MNQVELLDANDYVVDTATQYYVPDANVAVVEAQLLAETAPRDAEDQSRHSARRYFGSEYRTRVVPMTVGAAPALTHPHTAIQETAMPRPEFLTLPTDVLVKQRSICLRPELGEDPRMREALVDLADRASDELDRRTEAA